MLASPVSESQTILENAVEACGGPLIAGASVLNGSSMRACLQFHGDDARRH